MSSFVDYFLDVSRGHVRTTFSDFAATWWAALNNSQTPRELANVFFHAANSANPRKGVRPYAYVGDRNRTYEFMVNEFPSVTREVAKRKPRFDDVDRMLVLAAHETLSLIPTTEFFGFWRKLALKNGDYFQPSNIARSLKYLSKLATYAGDDVITLWAEELRPRYSEMTAENKATLVYALAIQDFLGCSAESPSPSRKMAEFLLDSIAKEIDPVEGLAQLRSEVYYAAKYFGHVLADTYPIEPENFMYSQIEVDTTVLLQNAGMGVRDFAGKIELLDHGFDISLSHKGRIIHLEIDSPHHFSYNDDKKTVGYNGVSQFQMGLHDKLRSGEDIILRVPIHMVRAFRNQADTWMQLLDNAAERSGGLYIAHAPDEIRSRHARKAFIFPLASPYNPATSLRLSL